MKKAFLVVASLVLSFTSFAVQFPKRGSMDQFIPKGWTIENKVTGDLNKDGLADVVLLMHSPEENDSTTDMSTTEKAFLILLAEKNGKYTLIAKKYEKNTPSFMSGGDMTSELLAYTDFEIKSNHSLHISYEYARVAGTNVFRWENGQLRLIGMELYMRNGFEPDGEVASVNLLTNKAEYKRFIVAGEQDEISTTTNVVIKRKHTFDNLDPFEILDQVRDRAYANPKFSKQDEKFARRNNLEY